MKRKLIIGLIIVIFIGITLLLVLKPNQINNESPKNETKEEINYEDYIKNILNYSDDETINYDFLEWIYNNYGIDTIKNLENAYQEKTISNETWHDLTGNSFIVLNDLYNGGYENVDNVKVINTKKDDISLSFVGDVSLADNWYVMPKYDERNKKVAGILSDEVLDIMRSSDVMVANNEFTVSNRGQAMSGKAFTFRGSPERLTIYEEMGVDLVTLANNHVYDFGTDAFLDLLTSLDSYNIPRIGAGKTIEEAAKPYYFVINGRKIGFVNATRAEKNILTPGATSDSPGVLRCYDPTYFSETIKKTKENSDYVIALIHWGAEGYHTLEDVQIETGKLYLDSGADVIVGGHAHKLQGMEFYDDKLIAYNLGDFIFNAKTLETGIFTVKINNDGKLNYYFDPCYESNVYTELLHDEKRTKLFKNMEEWSVNAQFLDTGEIIPK